MEQETDIKSWKNRFTRRKRQELTEQEDYSPETKYSLLLEFIFMHWKTFITLIWPLIGIPILLQDCEFHSACRFMYILFILIGYWTTECIPHYMTALLPVIMIPLMGIQTATQTTVCYFKEPNMMFLGCIFISIAIRKSGLGRRLAVLILIRVGFNPDKLLLYIMMITMFLSFFIWNTIVITMLLPIVTAMISEFEMIGLGSMFKPATDQEKEDPDVLPCPTDLTKAFYLGIAFASSTGGLGTLIGTGTTMEYKDLFEKSYPEAEGILDFLPWFLYNTPIVISVNIITWFWLNILYLGLFRDNSEAGILTNMIKEKNRESINKLIDKKPEFRNITWSEACILIMCIFVILAIFFRQPIFMTGWADYLPDSGNGYIKDTVPVMIMVFLMLVIPANPKFKCPCNDDVIRNPEQRSPPLITWRELTHETLWGILFLQGCALVLASAAEVSGFNKIFENNLLELSAYHNYKVMCILTLTSSLLAEVFSSVPLVIIIIPRIFKLSQKMEVTPILLAHPAAIGCAQSYMFPVANPATNLVAGYGHIRIFDMMITGGVVKILAYIITILFFPVYGQLFWNLETLPDWALGPLANYTILKSLDVESYV